MDKMTNQQTLDQVRGLLRACELFLNLNGRIPLRCVQAFLLVAAKPGLSVGEYARQAGLSTSTMSRNLLDIGERNRDNEAGFGLVAGRDNPNNRREKEFSLTPVGTALLNKVLAQIKR
jgi:DNA-binding MarR family transcriptional regulator